MKKLFCFFKKKKTDIIFLQLSIAHLRGKFN